MARRGGEPAQVTEERKRAIAAAVEAVRLEMAERERRAQESAELRRLDGERRAAMLQEERRLAAEAEWQRMDHRRELAQERIWQREQERAPTMLAPEMAQPRHSFRQFALEGAPSEALARALAHAAVRAETLRNGPFDEAFLAAAGMESSFTGAYRAEPKGLTRSDFGAQGVDRVVVTHTALDAVTYHQLHGQGNDRTHYVSVGGALTVQRADELREALEDISHGMLRRGERRPLTVVAAFNRTSSTRADEFALARCVPDRGQIEYQQPTAGKTWNEALQVAERGRLGPQLARERSFEIER